MKKHTHKDVHFPDKKLVERIKKACTKAKRSFSYWMVEAAEEKLEREE